MANRYWVPGGSGAWNNTNNWSNTSGGASGASIPGSADDVYFDANSGNGNSQVITSDINNLDCTGFLGSWSGIGTIRVFGNTITMSSSMTSTWTGIINPIGASMTITSNGFLWNALTISTPAQTITLVGSMSITQYTHTGGGTTNTINGDNLIWRGTGQFSMSSGRILTGTSLVVLAPTTVGSISISGNISSNVEINSPGTITQIGTITITGGTWTYVTGTWSFGTTQFVASNCTLNLAGMPIYGLTISTASSTVTLTSTLTCTNNILISTNCSLAGTHGFITPLLTIGTNAVNGRTLTLKAGVTYEITSRLNTLSIGYSSRCTINSDTPGVKAILKLAPGADAFPAFVDITDIDSGTGRQCKTFMGVLSNTVNWVSVTSDVPTISTSS